jgi:hypothetical protein
MSALLTLFDENPLAAAIRSLFAAGEQGAWYYDLSDFSTLFQDSAGTTPVTAVGQPVGLMLDKRLGLALGAEQVVNGTFTGGGTGWTNPDTAPSVTTFTGGVATMVAAPGYALARLRQSLTLPAGTYEVSVRVVSISGTPGAALAVGNTSSGDATYTNFSLYSAGVYTRKVTITGPTLGLAFTASNVVGGTIVIDDVSVKLLPGNHAYQTTLAARQTAQSNYLSLDKTDDHLLVAAGGAGTTGFLLVAGIMVPAAGTARTLWSDRGTNTGYKVGIDASNQIVFSAGNGAGFVSATGPALVAGTKYVITAWHDGANLNISVNNGAPTQAAFVTATAGTATFTIGKSNGAASEYWGDRIYGMIYRKNDASNAGQRNQAYSYMVGKMGGL